MKHRDLHSSGKTGVPPRRVLVAKVGLDRHDRGVRVIARAFREAGFEVIYLPAGHTVEEIAQIAVDEDVRAIGLSMLLGSHTEAVPDLQEHLREKGVSEEILIYVGGTIPSNDASVLEASGVRAVYGPGTPIANVVARFQEDLA